MRTQRKVLSKDGYSNRWLMKKMFFRAMLVLGVCFTCLFSNISAGTKLKFHVSYLHRFYRFFLLF